jgi:23S rRNA (pseudouridine1915-N3)-methyltransferase
MTLYVHAVGRIKSGPLKDLCDDYAGRLRPPAMLREVEEKKPLSGDELKRREADLLLKDIPDAALVLALDERGRSFTSTDFAHHLTDWRQRAPDQYFLIGGADGLHRSVLDRADVSVAFGPMTWPHQIARLLLLEQLYRAQSIAEGHPYHRA